MWGSVGYLARSAALGVTYAGHPARRRFLAQTSLASGLDDAASITIGALNELRLRHFVAAGRLASSLLGLVVPPLISYIIEEARTPEDLFRVALQHREQYPDLRRWLVHFQQALNDRDAPRIKEYHDAIDTFVQHATRAHTAILLRLMAIFSDSSRCGSNTPSRDSSTGRALTAALATAAVSAPGRRSAPDRICVSSLCGN